jgi:hypothetical protein
VIKTSWIYGLVIYAGMNCKIMKHRGEKSQPIGWFKNKIDIIYLSCLVINVLIALIYTLIYMYGH